MSQSAWARRREVYLLKYQQLCHELVGLVILRGYPASDLSFLYAHQATCYVAAWHPCYLKKHCENAANASYGKIFGGHRQMKSHDRGCGYEILSVSVTMTQTSSYAGV